MTVTERDQILRLIRQEVVPAVGCTEPVAVALAAAKAAEVLGAIPDRIEVSLSANVLKNAMGVGIPGTGMIGLPIAIALGALVGKPEEGLELLKDISPSSLEEGKKMIREKRIAITLNDRVSDKLYIEVFAERGGASARAIIRGSHTRFVRIEKDGEILFERDDFFAEEEGVVWPDLNMDKVFRFATETPLEEIRFILESAHINKAAAQEAFDNNYGHSLGRTLIDFQDLRLMGDSVLSRILAHTSAACDARMAGARIPVMTNSGSGNQGITATLPVVLYAEEYDIPEDLLIRALTLSHLTVIYIKESLGRLSALCGCVVASTGSACGITYLMGGGYREVTFAVKNMVANLAGVICDGAKPSCSLKVSSSVSTAVFSAMMAIEGKSVTSLEGIIDEDVDRSIRNLTRIGSEAMNETDKMILEIMINK